MSFVLDANGVYSAISSLEQRAHGGDGAEEQQQAHRRWLQQLWGGEPSYVEQAEDRGRWLLSSLLYTWASPVMGVAAREALRTEDLPQPTRTFRAYNAGWRLSVEMQRQRERRHMWDDMLGQRVVLRRGRGCGVLRYVGPVQQYGLPDQLYAGVEWEEVPEGRATRSPVTPGALLFSGEVAGEHLFDYVEGTIAAITFEPVEDVAVFSASTASTKTTTHPRTISPHGALMSAMGWHLLPLGGLLLLVELEVFVSPMLLKAYIRYLNDQENREESSWCEGLTLVAAYGIMTTVHSLLFHAYQLQFMKCALLYRSALQACLFEKCCTISGRSLVLPHLHPGRIINLLSTDVDCVMNFCQTLWLAVTTPLQVLVGVYLLHQLVGWVGMAGVSVLLLGIPFQAVIARLVASCYRQWADATDARLRVANQFLRGIRAIKFLGREPEFVVAMEQRRAVELHWVHRAQNLWVAMLLGNTTLPHLATASLLLMYSRTGTHLMPELVYPAISVLGILQSPFQMLPLLVHTFAQYRTSMRRLRQFFEADEIQDSGVPLSCTDGDPHHAAVFDAATVRGYRASVLRPSTQGELPDVYDVRAKDLLRDVSLRIPRGKLSVVLGPTGSGKSTLVDSLIGALEVTRGRVAAESSIAYVPQQPWIMNATLRENVVFFAEMDAVRFERALACSQLLSDLSLLADGVETEIGEKGINLSGGQKARVSLARAVYADRELYLLDDPLSALDAHVGERVLEECVCGALGGKTRVLATHHVHAASRADYVIVMKDGVVTYQGSYRDFVCVRGEVLTDCFGFGVGGRNGSGVDDVSVHDDLPPSTLSYVASCDALDAAASARVSLPASASLRRHRGGSAVVCVEESPAVDVGDSERRGGGFEEERATGSVPLSTYWEYLRLCGSVRALVIVALVFVAMEAADQGPGLWLAAWTGGQLPTWSSASCMRVYMVLTAAAVVSTPVRLFACFVLARRGCRRIHERLLRTVASATLPFLEGTPTGLLMNRFAKDVRNIDAELPNAVLVFLLCGMYVASTMCVLISSQWVMLLVVIPCSIIFYRILLYSCAVSREVRRLLNVTYSPLLSLLGEAVHGRWIFAAFGKLPSLLAESRRRVDDVFACAYLQSVSIRWIGVRVDAFSTVLVTSLALMGVVSVHVPWLPLNAGFLYLSLTNSRGFMVVVTRLVAAAADVEASMNSVERVARYGNRNVVAWEDIDLLRDDGAGECSDVVVGDVSPAAPVLHVWDHGQGMGTLAVRHVSLRYRDGLPLVLRDVSFAIGAGQKVGVVGRTGSGKSTLLLAFLRLVEVCEGEIVVCGKPARSYALRELRQLFSMIPQDPVLFEGTVRSNVDPFGAASDAEVWDALEQVGMAERVRCEAGGVDCRVLEGGSNLSVGQRQLLCLARALLRRGSAFILMDEATANVDPALDRQIQQTVRETFRDYTVVTIAHRLHTVASYDMILVMDGGRLVESGSPRELVQRRGSAFEQFVESMGEEAQEEFRGALDRAELMQVAAEVATKRRSTRPM